MPLSAQVQTTAPPSTAAPTPLPPEAQDALKKGVMAAQQQEWLIAIQSFQEARKTAPDAPVLFYNLGLAESKIPGRELRAIAWFGAYLAASQNAPNAAAVNDAIVGLQIKSEGNIERMVNVVQEADGLIPDTPITHDNGITGFTNKPDIDRVMDLYKVAVLWADAGNSAKAIDLAHRIGAAGYNQSESLSEIVVAQAGSGHLADAIKTAASWYDVNDSETAQLAIAAAQAKDGDSAAAKATLAAAESTIAGNQSAYVRNSELGQIARAQAEIGDIQGAQRTAGLVPSPEAKSRADIDIAHAQVHAGDLAGAQASLLLAQQGVDRWISLTNAQKIVACECALDPHENLGDLEVSIAGARIEAGDLAGARAALLVAAREAATDTTANRNYSASNIVCAQAKAGDISGAQATAALISDPSQKYSADSHIANAQMKAGDFAGATKTVEMIADVQLRSILGFDIAEARRTAAARANGLPPAATEPDSTTPHRAAPPAPFPAISLADWTGELDRLDRLNAPIFLDLSAALKTPQATFKTMYPGSSGYDDSNGDPKKIFDALVAIANREIAEKNTIYKMLKQQTK